MFATGSPGGGRPRSSRSPCPLAFQRSSPPCSLPSWSFARRGQACLHQCPRRCAAVWELPARPRAHFEGKTPPQPTPQSLRGERKSCPRRLLLRKNWQISKYADSQNTTACAAASLCEHQRSAEPPIGSCVVAPLHTPVTTGEEYARSLRVISLNLAQGRSSARSRIFGDVPGGDKHLPYVPCCPLTPVERCSYNSHE